MIGKLLSLTAYALSFVLSFPFSSLAFFVIQLHPFSWHQSQICPLAHSVILSESLSLIAGANIDVKVSAGHSRAETEGDEKQAVKLWCSTDNCVSGRKPIPNYRTNTIRQPVHEQTHSRASWQPVHWSLSSSPAINNTASRWMKRPERRTWWFKVVL